MNEPSNSKPRSARLPEAEAPTRGGKPTPARELAALESPEAVTESDLPEAVVSVEGTEWTVRVLGRAGGAGRGSAPLLLLGFWDPSRPDAAHALEAMVVARTLSELTAARLEAALAEASPPPPTEKRKPFFEGAGQGRRGGSSRREG